MAKKEDKLKKVLTQAFGVVTKPVTLVTDGFNLLVHSLESMTGNKESVSEVDGFVDELMNELKSVEKSFFAFFGEIVFIHNLADSMASLENELELMNILGERIQKFITVDLLLIYVSGEKDKSLMPCYKKLPRGMELSPVFTSFAEENFIKGEAKLFENKMVEDQTLNILAIPLRTTSDKYGIVLVGRKKRKGTFSPEEITLILAGSTMVSFALSNFKLNQKILRDEKLVILGQTIGSISHDIKNILTNFEGGLEILDRSIKENDAKNIGTAKQILDRSYSRMKEMVLSMVDYSRERLPDLQPTNFNGLLESVIQRYNESFDRKKVRIIRNFDLSIPEVYVDPYRIERMISNLLINAIDAVKDNGGVITIETKYQVEHGILEFSIKDNGMGIPPQALDRIFELFYSTKGSRGTGFGLAIVQKVIQEHNGTIEVSSEIDKGTEFHVKLPAKTSL